MRREVDGGSLRDRSMLTLALLGDRRLRRNPVHIRATVNNGASKTAVLEAFQRVAIYAGVR